MERIYRRDILDFVTVATEFCKQVEQCSGSERGEFTTVMQRLLPMVYLKAAFIDEIEEGVGYVDAVVTESDYEYVRTQIAAIMRDARACCFGTSGRDLSQIADLTQLSPEAPFLPHVYARTFRPNGQENHSYTPPLHLRWANCCRPERE